MENDLSALKISHNLVIDTAVLYKHPRGGSYKSALRVLAKRFLSKEIQQSGNGHDSIEDARTALELALLKIKHGKEFFPESEMRIWLALESIFEENILTMIDIRDSCSLLCISRVCVAFRCICLHLINFFFISFSISHAPNMLLAVLLWIRA